MSPWAVFGLCVLGVLVLLAAAYLIMTKPQNRGGLEKYKDVKFAHRGLHGDGLPENSLAAFKRAVDLGFGIELDVHTVKDGEVVVFHDGTLDRMVGISGKLSDYTAQELSQMRLLGSNEKIPTFREVLELVGGKVPLLVEMKQDLGESGVAVATAKLLRDYAGDYIVESFNPITLAEFAKEMPEVRRGILSHHYSLNPKYRAIKFRLGEIFLFNVLCKPDFIAFDHKDAGFLPFRLLKAIYKPVTVAWTVCSPEDEKAAYDNGFDTVIFEKYVPEK